MFITGYSGYISEGYEVAALHYLMKPVKKEKLFEVLDRAAEKPCHKDSDKACRRYGDTSATGVRD